MDQDGISFKQFIESVAKGFLGIEVGSPAVGIAGAERCSSDRAVNCTFNALSDTLLKCN